MHTAIKLSYIAIKIQCTFLSKLQINQLKDGSNVAALVIRKVI